MRIGIAALLAASIAFAALSQAASAAPIREQMYVPVGGIQQWIAIKGGDRANPVVLVLHGGPGNAWSPFADALFAGWEKDFTLVQWDQRGAGRTFGKNGASLDGVTVARMADDGIEVAAWLRQHLHKKKIIIVGASWGSVLGIQMAYARPDLFHAYAGMAQMVHWQRNVAASYARVLERARAAGDQPSIAALTAIGPPPWNNIRAWPVFRKILLAYQAKAVTAAPAPQTLNPDYASAEDRAQYEAADDASFMHFWGMTLSGPFTRVDLPALGTRFAIPIYVVQGAEDLTAMSELAKPYFDSITAPRKQFHLVPGTGHEPSAASMALVRQLLVEQVRPSALAE